ncbi:hypothetical protein Sru01_48660 [Sphaerisporangium rufum]|uniref:Protein kinase domain-containing protein n=1 Tax=Sphaerisporangium rufum TaxID=1381558 RepID=A0A919R581_9ACTN|nr:protein kinase [Sphaerisporangium rufum]GII79884.1 hypothetical protein Sru01_48660 [Sphaerisporangium rufum]
MPQVAPLHADDPPVLAGHRLVARLGEGARSVVYLARDAGGEQVAVKHLRADVTETGRFLARVEELRQVSAFCTAQVLETGEAAGRPYIVSEYIDGPTLRAAVADDGPMRGAALHRLAIGTMTALVAIHQAGIAHLEFHPGNVLLGPDGPRVIDFGVAQALDAGMDSTTRAVGSPAYLAPEQLEGTTPGPAADMFAWAATMLFAASGESPFDAGSMSATINRVLYGQPDLAVLDGDLLSLVAECLSKDPARRPTAGEGLLRLVGHSQLLATTEQAAVPAAPAAPATPLPADAPTGPPPPDPAARVDLPPPVPPRRRRPWALLGAAAVAIAIVSGGTVYALAPRPAPVAAPAPSPTPVPTSSAVLVDASPSPPPAATKTVTGAGVKLTTHENPADPIRLNAYFIADIAKKKYETYVRDPGADTFKMIAKDGEFGDPLPSPDGRWIAINPWLKFAGGDHDYLTFIDRATGAKFSVETLEQPLRGLAASWSRDSRRVLLTVYEFDDKKKQQYPTGFVTVDVTTRKATIVRTDDQRDGYGNFVWSPDGRFVVGAYEKKNPRFGLRFRDLTGNVVRTLPWVGLIPGDGTFSPSGRSFYTYCPTRTGKDPDYCVWSAETGNRIATIPSGAGDSSIQQWWDEHHLLVLKPAKKEEKWVVIDFHGEEKRTLVETPKAGDRGFQLLRFGGR